MAAAYAVDAYWFCVLYVASPLLSAGVAVAHTDYFPWLVEAT